MYTSIRTYRLNRGDIDEVMHRVDRGLADAFADFDVERMGVMGGEVMVSRAAAEMLEPAHH